MVKVLSVSLGTFPHNFSSIKGEDGKTVRTPIDGEGVRKRALISLICWMRSPTKRFDGTFDYGDRRVSLFHFSVNNKSHSLYADGPYIRTLGELSTLDDAYENGLVKIDDDDVIILTHKGKTWDYSFE